MSDQLTRGFFERRLRTTFRVTPDLGACPIGLTLEAVKIIHPPSPSPRATTRRRPASDSFALLFHGPVDPVLQQSIYMLRPEPSLPQHPRSAGTLRDDSPETPFFLIPLGLAPHPHPAMQYEVFFSPEED